MALVLIILSLQLDVQPHQGPCSSTAAGRLGHGGCDEERRHVLVLLYINLFIYLFIYYMYHRSKLNPS